MSFVTCSRPNGTKKLPMRKRSTREIAALVADPAGRRGFSPPPQAHHIHQYLHLVAAAGASAGVGAEVPPASATSPAAGGTSDRRIRYQPPPSTTAAARRAMTNTRPFTSAIVGPPSAFAVRASAKPALPGRPVPAGPPRRASLATRLSRRRCTLARLRQAGPRTFEPPNPRTSYIAGASSYSPQTFRSTSVISTL